jgi:hypothetical protein
VEYGYLKKFPHLLASLPDHEREFAPDGDVELNTPHALKRWAKLLKGAASVCVYAALLQMEESKKGEPAMEIWILQRIKTKNGSWKIDDDRVSE